MNSEEKNIVLCSIATIIAALKLKRKREKKMKRNRTIWSQKWLLRRDSGLGFGSMLINELRLEDPKAFYNFARMSFASFNELLQKVSPYISRQNTHLREAISASARLLLTLRFLATGERFQQLSYGFRISTSSIGRIIPETLEAIYTALKDDFLKVPQSKSEWKKIAEEFETKWNFPFCLGAIDGKHIAIRARKEYGSFYYNYKGFHSVILLAVVDANYKFLYVNVGSNGRANDAAVFNESSLCQSIQNNKLDFPLDVDLPGTGKKVPYVFVADDAFRLTARIIKPYGERSTNSNKTFNYRLSRSRRVVENAFGILANKFQIFQKEIDLPVEKVDTITLAACSLHNFIRIRDGFDAKSVDFENTSSINMENGSWRNEVTLTKIEKCLGNRSGDEGRKVRDAYSEYFNGKGSVSWQNEAVKKFNF